MQHVSQDVLHDISHAVLLRDGAVVLDGQDHRVSVRGEYVCVCVCVCVCVTHADTAKACSLTALITSSKRILEVSV